MFAEFNRVKVTLILRYIDGEANVKRVKTKKHASKKYKIM